MKNRKMVMTESGKSKTKLFALLGLCASFVCTLTAGAVAIPVNAMSTGTVTSVNELFDVTAKSFSQTNLNTFFSKLGAEDYNSLYANLRKGNLDSAQIASLNSNQGDVKVTFGGKEWTVTYVSKTKSGEVIATLMAAEPTTATYAFSHNGWTSSHGGYDPTTGIAYDYWSNIYGSSWIRSEVLNIGSKYLSTGSTALSDAITGISLVDGTQTKITSGLLIQ